MFLENKMNNNIFVSIIVPVYNVEKYLSECIESLIAQTYKNIEIILVDDGSTDNSGHICDSFKCIDKRIKVVHKNNEGLGFTRNVGLEYANGNFVYFVDSDDYIETNEIELMVKDAINNGAEVIYSGFIQIDDNGKVLKTVAYEEELFDSKKIKQSLIPRMFGDSPNKKDQVQMSAAGQMYSMEIIRNNNLKFVSEREFISEDFEFNLNFLKYASWAFTTSRMGNYYRYNEKSLSHSYDPNRFSRCKKLYISMLDYLKENDYSEDVYNRWRMTFFKNTASAISQEASQIASSGIIKKLSCVKSICNDDVLQKCLKDYSNNVLDIRNRLYIFLLKTKSSAVLLLIFSVFRNRTIRKLFKI